MSNTFDGADIVWGAPGPPGAATVEQVGDHEARIDALEALPVPPDTTTDLTDWSTTAPVEGQLAIYTGGKWTPTTRPPITVTTGLSYVIDGGGAAITTGTKYGFQVPHDFAITGWTLAADVSTTATVNVWIDTYANYPPTSADIKITMSLSAAMKNTATVTPTSYTAGSWVFFAVTANSAATVLLPNLTITRTI